MDFLKKHYEKILLGVMLAGLIGVLVFMLFYIAAEKDAMTANSENLSNPHVNKLPDLDTSPQDAAIARLKSASDLDLESTNKLLNPMEWQRNLDGMLIPADKKTGAQMVVVTGITPLYLIISLDAVITNDLGTTYEIKVTRQAAATMAKRAATPYYIPASDPYQKPNETFALDSIQGMTNDPDALMLKLVDTGEVVAITREKPYRQVEGYSANFRYDPERKVFTGKRVGDKQGIAFGGEDYAVVEVNSNELILEDQSNQKKTSLRFVP